MHAVHRRRTVTSHVLAGQSSNESLLRRRTPTATVTVTRAQRVGKMTSLVLWLQRLWVVFVVACLGEKDAVVVDI